MTTRIIPLAEEHAGQAAELHMEHLRTAFSGAAGLRLLRLYYSALAGSDGGVGYVAQDDRTLQGFVCGIWSADRISRQLRKSAPVPLVYWTAVQVLTHPAYLHDLARRLCSSKAENGEDGYELRPIVVDGPARGTGVAVQLAVTLLQDAHMRGFSAVYLHTGLDNVVARRFYEKLGFEQIDRRRQRGRNLVEYKVDLGKRLGVDA